MEAKYIPLASEASCISDEELEDDFEEEEIMPSAQDLLERFFRVDERRGEDALSASSRRRVKSLSPNASPMKLRKDPSQVSGLICFFFALITRLTLFPPERTALQSASPSSNQSGQVIIPPNLLANNLRCSPTQINLDQTRRRSKRYDCWNPEAPLIHPPS